MVRAQETTFPLREDQWTAGHTGQAGAGWDGAGVTLQAPGGAAATASITSRQPINGDFIATVDYQLIDWQSGDDTSASMAFGLRTPIPTAPNDEQFLSVGRDWTGPMDLFQSATRRRQAPWRRVAGGISVERTGQLQILRRGGQARVAYRVEGPAGGGWQTLQIFDMYSNQEMLITLTAGNAGAAQAVRVRFSNLRINKLPALKRPGNAGTPTGPPQGWVIYGTGPGWLRIGSVTEFLSEQKLKDEIWGGNSEAPLPKKLLKDGFAKHEDALRYLCENLTKVHIRFDASATPKEVVRAIYDNNDDKDDDEYFLRLDRGNDPEAVLAKGQEYDLASEKKILAAHNLTPRVGFRKQWLVHAIGHGTIDGDVKDDRWMLLTTAPTPDPKNPGQATFTLSDGWGGTVGYRCDKWEGPYRDNYGLARAMKRLGIPEVELYPPANNYSRKIVLAEVPDQPRDFGPAVLGVQPIVDGPEMQEWLVYSTGDAWLHIGTRQEFEHPVKARETPWAGDSDEVMQRVSLPMGRRFFSYSHALAHLTKQLHDVRVGYFATAQPREVVTARLNGLKFMLGLARDPDVAVAGYGAYNLGAELATLASQGLSAFKTFQKQWLAHATGHGTYSGDVKDDFWMMVGTEPKNGGVTIPDGQGGTFGYSVDQVQGPFQESSALISALRGIKLKSIRLYGEDRIVSVDDVAKPVETAPVAPQIASIVPNKGEAEQSFYITIIAKGMQPGYHFRFGPGVIVTNETNLGKDPDSDGERWLATVTVDKEAKFTSGQ